MVELECIVRGRVQGVMFRDFVRRQARRLSLHGAVKNRGDGTVHVTAQGEEASLHELLRRLSRGPALARVDLISVGWPDPAVAYEEFSIVYE